MLCQRQRALAVSFGNDFYSQLNNKIVELSSFPFLFVFFDGILGNSRFSGSSTANVSLETTDSGVASSRSGGTYSYIRIHRP